MLRMVTHSEVSVTNGHFTVMNGHSEVSVNTVVAISR